MDRKGERMERDRTMRTKETSEGTNRNHGRESNVVGITRLLDYATTTPTAAISALIH